MKTLSTILLLFISINLYPQSTSAEDLLKNHFKKNINEIDEIEGIWLLSVSRDFYTDNWKLYQSNILKVSATVVIARNGEEFKTSLISKDNDEAIFEINSYFKKTASSSLYIYHNDNFNKIEPNSSVKANATLDDNIIELSYEWPSNFLKKALPNKEGKVITNLKWVKIYPTIDDYETAKKESGTGDTI
jgi:hypothetical protein